MKKTVLGLIFFVILIMTGCGKKEEATVPLVTNNASPTITVSESPDAVPIIDLTDKKVLYAYVNSNIIDLTQEDFDTWEIYYSDITGEGTNEAVLVSTYGANWHNKVEILSVDSGEIKAIPCNINAGKNGTKVDYTDGFLVVTASSSGTGEFFTIMELYIYAGSQMVNVLNEIYLEHQVASQDVDFFETGSIEGGLKDFEFTITKEDRLTGETSVIKKSQYSYDPETMMFEEKSLLADSDNIAQSSDKNDYSFQVKDGSLYIVYGDTSETYIEGGRIYDIVKDNITMQEELYVLSAYQEGNLLYFTVKAPDYSVGKVLYYCDLNTGFIFWVGTDTNANEEGEGVRLTQFSDETLRSENVQYSDYAAVIVPMYPLAGLNYNLLTVMPFVDIPDGYDLNFAIFGTLEGVNIKRYDNDEIGYQWDIGDLTNTILSIHSGLQSDRSYYKITGVVHVGEGLYEDVSFTLDDMRDSSEYGIYLIR